MNGRKSKKIRSEVRGARKQLMVSVMREIVTAPFRDRLRLAWRILRGAPKEKVKFSP